MWKGFRNLFGNLRKSQKPRWFLEALALYKKDQSSSDQILLQHLEQNQALLGNQEEHDWHQAFVSLAELRSILNGNSIESAFLLESKENESPSHYEEFDFEELFEASRKVRGLLWKVYCVSQVSDHPLEKEAKKILEPLVKVPIDTLIEAMQKEEGIPFLLLNSVARKNWGLAKTLGRQLLSKEIVLEEETRVCLYWISEILWFSQSKVRVSDFESTIRYLYHLCFINPERAGFLEIDSQFFSQFDSVSELAQEGLLFKETLINRILSLWEQQGVVFNSVFVEALQLLTQQKNKIYQDLPLWKQWWSREEAEFEKSVLFCVEGNLHYAAKRFKEALECYDRSLQSDPHLRPALLNRVFCLAQLGLREDHENAVEDLVSRSSLFPSNLIASGNSFLLTSQKDKAQTFFSQLSAEVEGWDKKTEYYQSIFCLEHELFEEALHFARLAFEKAPDDQRYGFHLSRCLKESGRIEEALEVVRTLSLVGPEWLLFYRFTLERDAGLVSEAHQTLCALSDDYFDDPEELQEAVEFAKTIQDLSLLRRFKIRAS